jgi:hypothetical protein
MYHFTILYTSRRGPGTKLFRGTPEACQAELDYLAAHGCWNLSLDKAVAL